MNEYDHVFIRWRSHGHFCVFWRRRYTREAIGFYSRTASFLGSRTLAVCCISTILFWRSQTRWLVLMMSFSSSWNKEQACRARSDSCRRVRDRTTLLMAQRSSKSRPSSSGIWCLQRSCGSTILFANGILHARKYGSYKPDVNFHWTEGKRWSGKRTTSK